MKPNHWDYRPKQRNRSVPLGPKRKPRLRFYFLIFIGIGIYFGFEPLAKWVLPTIKKSFSPSNRHEKSGPKNQQASPEKILHAPEIQSVNNQAVWQPFVQYSSDSSEATIKCTTPINPCLEAIATWQESYRGLIQSLRHRTQIKTDRQWKKFELTVKLRNGVQPQFADPVVASLVELTFYDSQGKNKIKPYLNEGALELCIENQGCPGMPSLPVPVHAPLKIELRNDIPGFIAFTSKQNNVLALDDGWVTAIDTVYGLQRIELQHALQGISVYIGQIKYSPLLRQGNFIHAQSPMGQIQGDSLFQVSVYWIHRGQMMSADLWDPPPTLQFQAEGLDTTLTLPHAEGE